MNLELLESFGQNYPEEFDGELDCISLAVTCAFNRQGTLLAVGCNDGRIVIWDFLTRGIAKIICAHVHPVCSLSWSRNGHKLLSASTDSTVCIWDVISGDCSYRYRFPSPILKVQFHPRSEKVFLVCPMKHAAVVIDIETDHSLVPLDDESDLNIVASFDRKGEHIFAGNAKGKILIMTVPDLKVRASFKVLTGTLNTTAIKSIEFAPRGDCFLVNTADRIIRVYENKTVLTSGKDGEPEPMQKLQDLVNKTVWKKCVFSGDGEYICAGSARQHSLYIWEKSVRNPVKILHGRKGELLLDVVGSHQRRKFGGPKGPPRSAFGGLRSKYGRHKWHPARPIITSISSGVVSVWSQPQVENWSAFAPDFKELDENVEYEERESEFDLEDEDKSPQIHNDKDEEDEIVDVVTVDRITAFCSSSDEDAEDSDALLYLPIAPEIDEPEDGWGQGPEGGTDEPPSKKSGTSNEGTPTTKKKRAKTEDSARKDDSQRHSKPKEKSHHQTKKSAKSKSSSYSEGKSRPKHHDYRGWRDDDY